ncbi:MAG: aminotransferase class IV [Rhodospirillales bacterium]|nr:aminotransferase class IV [Rhodospirillales bacterium]
MKMHLNGLLVEADEARIDPTDRGLTLGDGLFETIAVRGAKPSRLDAHLARLRDGADVLGLNLPTKDRDLKGALQDVIEANDVDEGLLRLTVTRGPAPRGLLPPTPSQPTVMIVAFSQALTPMMAVSAVISTTTRRNEHSPLARIKTTNFLDGILAGQEAAKRGADDALLLNTAGNLAEASTSNLFLVLGGTPVTPLLAEGALPGVMRADVIKALGARERSLKPSDLGLASEAFLTNSAGIRALVSVDGVAIGEGTPGPVTKAAQKIV